MNADREELARYRKALIAHPAVIAGGVCPSPESIWEAARGELGPRQVAELADHTLGCSDCSLAWQLAVELGRVPEQPVGVLRSPRVFRRRQLWGGLLAAAAAVLLAVAIPWQPPSGYRGGGVQIERVDESLSRENCVLRWRSPWKEATYSIKVSDERFELIVEDSGLTVPEYPVPSNLIGPGQVLNWYVEATAPDGATLDRRSFRSRLK